jgi:dihydroorotate dehydrogenase electron transfer subunit
MPYEFARVLWNRPLGAGYFHLGLATTLAFAVARPGQFVMLEVAQGPAPLLRRPFSIHRRITEDGAHRGIEILFKVMGDGTARLARRVVGEDLGVLGPLGRGFVWREGYRRVYLAAGGIGVAPLVFLLEDILPRIDREGSAVFLGGRSQRDLLCREEFARLGVSVHLTTDDGSCGEQCFLTDPLEAACAARSPDVIFACGPMDMLRCVAGIAGRHGVACQVSIEARMACGLGACLGCAVEGAAEGADKYLHVCMDGPVFEAHRLRL